MRRKLDQISSPLKTVPEFNSTQHRPSVERSRKMANASQTNGKFEFYLSWKYPCMKQYRETPVYKTSKESAHCKRTESIVAWRIQWTSAYQTLK